MTTMFIGSQEYETKTLYQVPLGSLDPFLVYIDQVFS